ncbi:hypothetical protein ZHAS_00018750 [Anopheles sinensis]|uniref:Uncharacterized protein n=1 Tax=Anopheles sinensis TaxID=74873 RepID=A0A084WKG5_ANOSI|nr:hypothetical protein ZHAS_00018750 [Anopheles sinensis]
MELGGGSSCLLPFRVSGKLVKARGVTTRSVNSARQSVDDATLDQLVDFTNVLMMRLIASQTSQPSRFASRRAD